MFSVAATKPRPVLFPNQYCWYVLVCALDVILTATIIVHMGGAELNGVALRIIQAAGLPGLVVFKFATAAMVVTICEIVGRRQERTALLLARFAVLISATPVALGLGQIVHFLAFDTTFAG